MSIAVQESKSASQALNNFLNFAAREGGLRIEHVRHTVRQVESEVYVRKVTASFHAIAPSATVDVKVTDVPGMGLNQASAELAHTALRLPAGLQADPMERFTLHQAATMRDWAAQFAEAPAFAHSPVTVTCGVTPLVTDEALLRAADSVFLQSMADVNAISRIAAESNKETAIKVASFVSKRRELNGDFTLYSLAPLSMDTKYAIQLLVGRLNMGADLTQKTSAQLLADAVMLARTSLSSWLEEHGVKRKNAVKLAESLANMERTLSKPLTKPSATQRPATRTP